MNNFRNHLNMRALLLHIRRVRLSPQANNLRFKQWSEYIDWES